MNRATEPESPETIGLLISGGLDSSVLLGQLLQQGHRVQPFYVMTDSVWAQTERQTLRRLLSAIRHENLASLVEVQMHYADVDEQHWSVTGRGVPDRDSPDHMVGIPGRVPLLLVKAILWCRAHGLTRLALATLAGNPFHDAAPKFLDEFERLMASATGGTVTIERPFEKLCKQDVIAMGSGIPWELTFSCLAPARGLHCGKCNKCEERARALRTLPGGDPTVYA